MWEEIIKLKKIYNDVETDAKNHFKRDKIQKRYTRWKITAFMSALVVTISLIITLIFLAIPRAKIEQVIVSTLAVLISTALMIICGYKLEKDNIYMDKRQYILLNYEIQLSKIYNDDRLKEIVEMYNNNLSFGLKKFQIYTSLFGATIVAFIIACIPKLIDFFSHRMSSNLKLFAVIMFIYLSAFMGILTFQLIKINFSSEFDSMTTKRSKYIDYINLILYKHKYNKSLKL